MERLNISRRDFVNGIALGAVAGTSLSPLELMAMASGDGYYPPSLTGLRGSHIGSYEVAHGVAWAGTRYPVPTTQTDDIYDLVVVGGGISGLAAAHFYRQRTSKDARILILDNHDDFGGHAKRNEFNVDGKKLIGYGGSQSIDGPGHYSEVASQLLKDVGIQTERFYDYYDQGFFKDRSLGRAIYFSADAYGKDLTLPNVFRGFDGEAPADVASIIEKYPLSSDARHSLVTLLNTESDCLSEFDQIGKTDFLRRTSYTSFLNERVGVPTEVTDVIRDMTLGAWGVGWDALSALEAVRFGMPATSGLGIDLGEEDKTARNEPYIFHFPDGNAGVARSLVRQMLPRAVPGHSMEDLVTSKIDYELLDQKRSSVNIRLNSTAVDVRHTPGGKQVDVTYVRNGETYRVRAKHAILACYNAMIPHICTELPQPQKEAIAYAEKVPLVYISIAVRNWQAFAKLGYSSVYIPNSKLIYSFGMDFPVSMGDYRFTSRPDEPTVIHGTWVPTSPDQGLSAREQHLAGRRRLYEISFADFEKDIVAKMNGALSGGGFDAARDIAAITVNRWPHGYAYEYNDYSDPLGWSPANGPHIAGRAQIGRISIANSDASAYAYVNGAIDAADRAVNEQIMTT